MTDRHSRRLDSHLAAWLGEWPPPSPLHVVGDPQRLEPAWDGSVRPVVGVASPDAVVVSVPPPAVDQLRAHTAPRPSLAALFEVLADAVDRPGWTPGTGVFRWSEAPLVFDEPGEWLPTADERIPEWLRPFNGDVLVGFTDGVVAAGVGRKQHDRHGHELAVVTEEGHRGQGWARRLVSQAAVRVLDEGAVPTYLHAHDNVASARTAEACGFPDRGWSIVGLFPGTPG